jgi:ABC-type polysaccharide/polyol phosphate transport system ATPase subunit
LPSDSERPAVVVEDLRVRFRTTYSRKQEIKHVVKEAVSQHIRYRPRARRTIEALRGVSFEVRKGSVYGVIGRNGAGKSTLFRVLSGIYPPTEGRVIVDGRITPLLSLGLGFNRELTGRENILLGGLANGLEPEQVRDHYDEIIEFADIGEAIDYPMRGYSNGMFARVGFAVAVFLDPEIILLDEALGAGDAVFRERCQEKLVELCQRDTTVLIVSHGMGMIKLLADRCMWIDEGKMQAEGDTAEVVEQYLDFLGVSESAATMDEY